MHAAPPHTSGVFSIQLFGRDEEPVDMSAATRLFSAVIGFSFSDARLA
jgi:hypothetical protein